MNLPREKGLYKNAGVKHPRILYEVWKSDDGEFLVDTWRSDTENRGAIYKLDNTTSLDYFEDGNKDKLERLRVRYRIYNNNYLAMWEPKKEKELTQLKQLMYKYKREAIQLIEGIR